MAAAYCCGTTDNLTSALLGEVLLQVPLAATDWPGNNSRRACAGPAHHQRPYAQGESSAAAVVSEVRKSDADLTRMMQEPPAVEDLLENNDDAPIIRMLNALLTRATRRRSTYRAPRRTSSGTSPGRLARCPRWCSQPRAYAALISRLKIMCDLDIAEKRLPQDGRISLRIGTQTVDVRVPLPSAQRRARCCACWTSRKASWSLKSNCGHAGAAGAETLRHLIANRTASSWSPDRPAQARPPRCAAQRLDAGSNTS